MNLQTLQTSITPTWCPGCGNYGIMAAFKNAAVHENWDSTNSVLVAGIGCHGNMTNFVKITSFEGLHGRAIPVAQGIKLANRRLNVFVFTGDGDCLGEGGNHFIHACRRNPDLTILIHNNDVFGLTTGQTSPLSPSRYVSSSTPAGSPDRPFSALSLALTAGATFVARAFADDGPSLTDLIIKANAHPGLAVIEILQPCVTFDTFHTRQYLRDNCYPLPADYDAANFTLALQKSFETGEKHIPLGLLYQSQQPTAEATFPVLVPVDSPRDISALL